MLHRKKECLQTVEQALKLKPDYMGSYLNMAGLCYEAQDDARALALLQHVSDSSASEEDALVKACSPGWANRQIRWPCFGVCMGGSRTRGQ